MARTGYPQRLRQRRGLFAHDLEHTCAARGAGAFHGFTAIGHFHLLGILDVPLVFALDAITLNCCCHRRFVLVIGSKVAGCITGGPCAGNRFSTGIEHTSVGFPVDASVVDLRSDHSNITFKLLDPPSSCTTTSVYIPRCTSPNPSSLGVLRHCFTTRPVASWRSICVVFSGTPTMVS